MEIDLKGYKILIDIEDIPIFEKYNWYVNSADKIRYYVVAKVYNNGKVKNIKLHRIIMNAPTNLYIDHINGNGLDNRRCNLRLCTNQQNQGNSRKRKKTSSIFKGVSWQKDKKKWRATITFNAKQLFLGLYNNEILAANAYDTKALELFGEFAYLNLGNKNE